MSGGVRERTRTKAHAYPPPPHTPHTRTHTQLCSRHVHPYISPSLREYICESYVDIRAKDKARSLEQAARSTTTPRQLLSILRLAEAHAKINIREVVEQSDIDEAIRLIQMSKASVVEAESTAARGARLDPISRMWDLIKDKLSSKPNSSACCRTPHPRSHLARSRRPPLFTFPFCSRSPCTIPPSQSPSKMHAT